MRRYYITEQFNLKTTLITLVIVLSLTSAVVSWYRERHKLVVSKVEYVKVPEIKTVTKIKRIRVPVKEVVTIEKKVIVERLNLPEEVLKDVAKEIVATGVVAPYEGNTNVVAVLDTKTGVSGIIAKQQPLSLFAFEAKKEVGVRYGFSVEEGNEIDAYGRYDFLRIGRAHLGVYGEANTRGEGKAMISVAYRW